MSSVVLDGKEYEVTRAKLRVWLQLEDIREQIARAADSKDRERFVTLIYSYLSVALSADIDYPKLPWYEVVEAYVDFVSINRPFFDFPFLKSSVNTENVPWDYEGRTWYSWSHMLMKVYSWELEYVAELDIDDAIALLQEIATSDQIRKEWEWMLSEKSISYDKQGKGTFHEYERPVWMGGNYVPPDKRQSLDTRVRVKKSVMPIGNVVRWNDGSIVTQ